MATGSILLSWPQQSSALTYAIRYRRIRPDFSNWTDIRVQAPSLRLDNQNSGTYEFEISSIGLFGATSSPAVFTYTLNAEAALSSAAYQGLGVISLIPISPELGLLTWNDPGVSGATVSLRHQRSTTDASWGQAASVLPPIPADHGHAYVPLLSGVYHARLTGGVLTTSVRVTRPEPPRTPVAEIDENPTFAGSTSGLSVDPDYGLSLGAALRVDDFALGEDLDTYGYLDGLPLIDTYANWDEAALFDSVLSVDDLGPAWDGLTSIDGAGGLASSGEYLFANTIDAGQTENVYLRRKLTLTPALSSDLIDDRLAVIDSWTDLDALEGGDADVTFYTQASTDNATWSEWQPFVNALVRGRYFRFKAVLSTTDPINNVFVDTLGVIADKD